MLFFSFFLPSPYQRVLNARLWDLSIAELSSIRKKNSKEAVFLHHRWRNLNVHGTEATFKRANRILSGRDYCFLSCLSA
jgi:hypothetical protein